MMVLQLALVKLSKCILLLKAKLNGVDSHINNFNQEAYRKTYQNAKLLKGFQY